jgi:hypothetical protein
LSSNFPPQPDQGFRPFLATFSIPFDSRLFYLRLSFLEQRSRQLASLKLPLDRQLEAAEMHDHNHVLEALFSKTKPRGILLDLISHEPAPAVGTTTYESCG